MDGVILFMLGAIYGK